jgi:TetR/AcrR family transcriptional repressor of lmrAB and yxaGH operons
MAVPDHERSLQDATPPPRRSRMSPTARRAELVIAARTVLTKQTDAGVAEIAQTAQVSKALLYRYFPAGRAELVGAVVSDLADELLAQVELAAAMPFSPAARLEQMLAAVFSFFVAEPGAYALLVGTMPGGPGSELAPKRAARVGLVSAISGVMAESGHPPGEVYAAATGLVGFVLATVELCLHDQLPPEKAWQLSCRCARVLRPAD